MAESEKDEKKIPCLMGIELVRLNETLDERLPSGPITTEANVFYTQIYRPDDTQPEAVKVKYAFLVADRINLPLELLRSAAEVNCKRDADGNPKIELVYAKGKIVFEELYKNLERFFRLPDLISDIKLVISDRKLLTGSAGTMDRYGVSLTENVIAHVVSWPY